MKPQYILLFLLLITFVVRLYRFDSPIADWHSWRQADTSAVSRNFVQHGFDIFHPRFDDISNVASGMDNPNGYRFVEFPFYNIAQAGLFSLFGILTLEEWGRMVTILVSTGATLLVYLLVANHSSKRAGLLAATVFGLLPYNIFYGRVILPDTSMMAATLAGIYFFDRWVRENEKGKNKTKEIVFFMLSLMFTVVALLLKPFAAFFLLPILAIAYKRWHVGFFKKWQLWLFAIFAFIPLILWRLWMSQFPEGIPVNSWLFNGNGIRLRPAFFRWILFERITKLISGYGVMLLGIAGVIALRSMKQRLFFSSFLLSSCVYVVVVATGNVQHDYYQIPIIPTVAIFVGLGAEFVLTKIKDIRLGYALVSMLFGISFMLAWNQVKDYFNINNRAIVVAGQAVQKLTPKDAKIIAPYDGDTSFLYQTNRKGWPSFQHSTEELMKMGASYLVIVNPKPYDQAIGKTYKVVASTPDFILFDLKQK